MLRDERSYVQILTPLQVYVSDDDFKAYKQGRFIANYTNLKEKNQQEKEAIDFNRESLIGTRLVYPVQNSNKKGKQDMMAPRFKSG